MWVRFLCFDYVWVDLVVLCLVLSMNIFNYLVFLYCDCFFKVFCGICMVDVVVYEFCELLDDIFIRLGVFGEDEGDDVGILLFFVEMRLIEEDVVKLWLKNIF